MKKLLVVLAFLLAGSRVNAQVSFETCEITKNTSFEDLINVEKRSMDSVEVAEGIYFLACLDRDGLSFLDKKTSNIFMSKDSEEEKFWVVYWLQVDKYWSVKMTPKTNIAYFDGGVFFYTKRE